MSALKLPASHTPPAAFDSRFILVEECVPFAAELAANYKIPHVNPASVSGNTTAGGAPITAPVTAPAKQPAGPLPRI